MHLDPLQESLESAANSAFFFAAKQSLIDQEMRLKLWKLQRLFNGKSLNCISSFLLFGGFWLLLFV